MLYIIVVTDLQTDWLMKLSLFQCAVYKKSAIPATPLLLLFKICVFVKLCLFVPMSRPGKNTSNFTNQELKISCLPTQFSKNLQFCPLVQPVCSIDARLRLVFSFHPYVLNVSLLCRNVPDDRKSLEVHSMRDERPPRGGSPDRFRRSTRSRERSRERRRPRSRSRERRRRGSRERRRSPEREIKKEPIDESEVPPAEAGEMEDKKPPRGMAFVCCWKSLQMTWCYMNACIP